MKKLQIIALSLMMFAAVGCCCKVVPLESTEWSVETLNGKEVEREQEENFSILFGEENRISAMGACNRIMGQYTQSEDGSLKIKSVGATMMFCPNLETEEEFIKTLEVVTRYEVKGDVLKLYNGDDVVVELNAVKKSSSGSN